MSSAAHWLDLDREFDRRARERRALATMHALDALERLDRLGIRAWVIGSLAKGGFGIHSDVDILVDAPRDREDEVCEVAEEAMGDFPFHLVFLGRVGEDALPFFTEGVLDSSGLRTCLTEAGRVAD
jgi:predicted nucleotidyltransferase